MSETTTVTKVHAKPIGYTDGGKVWLNDKSVYGMRYKCKSCGRMGAGYGGEERSHADDCPVSAPHREYRKAREQERADKANVARVRLAGIDWATVSDDLALRLVAEASK